MIGMRSRVEDRTDRVQKAADRATAGNVRAMAFLIQVDARQSIDKAPPPSGEGVTIAKTKRNKRGQFVRGSGKRRKRRGRRTPSPAGQPPYTRRGLLPRAIAYAADRDSAVIGPAFSVAGTSGEPHEDGGPYKGAEYPQRAFMGPARDRNLPLFGNSFQGSIGG